MTTEARSARYADLDLWPTDAAVEAMLEAQLAAAAAVQPQARAIARAADEASARLADSAGRLIYVGAGTSGRIAVQDGVELGPTYGWDGDRVAYLLAGGGDALVSSVEGAEDDAAAGEREMRDLAPTASDVIVAVAASGTTPYTVAALAQGRADGALTVGFANNPAAPLLALATHPILLDTGAEVVTGSTRMKAGTAQKIALNLFSTAIMLRLGRIHAGLMVDMRVSNAKLRQRAVAMIGEIAGVDGKVAEDALDQAAGGIKRAVLIALGQTPEQSAISLRSAGGNLRRALGRADTDE
ncbi:N-acetylmuramic acid 6-phosphate etherase [Novosphingobium endophyticum]|uniref:N-acetylmuramic acid 6-phosphate etherase n=1 Tax=Novosphingobium endophyticum TaxID=1955250 RepID=A0A916TPG0_9SPHN|nr:N-acetylmuramic acid 6-phosphate etherase [Novosphingobium endophyticum]GGB90331.1 N-acetylmuramic acid 6-phosphate etherase [Novosphingobium endophyticum]